MKATNHLTRIALVLGLSAAGVAFAQSPGSTDIYSTNFQKAYPNSDVMVSSKATSVHTGSTDIYATNFQKVYPSRSTASPALGTQAEAGSTDIYFTDFQRRYR
jgi:hypothetical protein